MRPDSEFDTSNSRLSRRALFKGLGLLGVGAVGASLTGCQFSGLIASFLGKKSEQTRAIQVGGPNGELVFLPDRLHVELGEEVTWEMLSGGHTVTAYHPDTFNLYESRIPEGAEPWDFDLLTAQKGVLSTWRPDKEGVYNYFCRPHESVGMVGVIVVGRALPGPGLSAPQQQIPSLARRKLEELTAWARSLS